MKELCPEQGKPPLWLQLRNHPSLLCEDWLTDGCDVVGCEQIAGAVQWENCYA